jgi:hypothetical protein
MIEYKLVPVEPTEERLKAGFRAWNACDLPKGSNSFLDWKDAYKAMIEDAPITESITIPLAEYEAMKKDAERYQKLKRLSAQARTFKEFAISRYNGMEWEHFENGQLDLDKTLDKAMEI